MTGEQERADMIEQLRERLVEFLHTKEGSRVAMQCVWHGTAKVCALNSILYVPGNVLKHCFPKLFIITLLQHLVLGAFKHHKYFLVMKCLLL